MGAQWHKLNESTEIATHNLYVFISTKISDREYRFQVLSNNGSNLHTWRSTFESHQQIIEQVELMIEHNNYN